MWCRFSYITGLCYRLHPLRCWAYSGMHIQITGTGTGGSMALAHILFETRHTIENQERDVKEI